MPKIQTQPRLQNGDGHAAGLLPAPGGSRLGDRLRLARAESEPAVQIVKIVSIVPPQLGEAAYHGKIGNFLRGVSPYTEATDPAVLAHLLPAIGTWIGPGPTFYAGNPQPPRVNFVVVGETNSGRKGTAASPVEELMNLVDEPFWKMQRAGGMSSGEGLIVKVADQKNIEGNVIVVEKRLFVLEEEFCRVLANMSRQGNILSPIIRQAFDNGNLCTLTVNPRYAFGAHVSIVAHITPEELANRFDGIEAANGFGNRFLWFYVASDKVIARPHPIPQKVFQAFAPRLRAVSGLKARQVPMDSDAQDFWESEYLKLRQDRPGTAGAIIARGPAIVLRLALIYAIVDQFQRPVIGVEHLRAALAVWQYNCESADLLFDSKTGSKLGDRLYHLIRTHGAMATKDFHKHLSNKQKRSLLKTLERLKAEKLIHSETIRTKGRPRTVWQLGDGL